MRLRVKLAQNGEQFTVLAQSPSNAGNGLDAHLPRHSLFLHRLEPLLIQAKGVLGEVDLAEDEVVARVLFGTPEGVLGGVEFGHCGLRVLVRADTIEGLAHAMSPRGRVAYGCTCARGRGDKWKSVSAGMSGGISGGNGCQLPYKYDIR
jgi:hypothetical protein